MIRYPLRHSWRVLERLKHACQIRLCCLWAGSNNKSLMFEVITTWAVVIAVSPCFIQASYKRTNTIRLFLGPLGANLDLVSKLNDQSTNKKRWLISEAVIDAFKSYIPREDSAIKGETGDSYSNMITDLEDLLLVKRELGVSLVDTS